MTVSTAMVAPQANQLVDLVCTHIHEITAKLPTTQYMTEVVTNCISTDELPCIAEEGPNHQTKSPPIEKAIVAQYDP